MTAVEDERLEKTITASWAEADLLTALGPNYAKPGDTITLGIEVKNTGEIADQIWTQIYNKDTGELVKNFNKYLYPEETWEWTDDFTMPNEDWSLVYRVGHFEVGEAITDDTVEREISIGEALPLVLMVAPLLIGFTLILFSRDRG